MANILDYIEWRGDVSMAHIPLGEVDALILNRFSYLPLDGLVPENPAESVSISELSEAFFAAPQAPHVLLPEDPSLLSQMAKSRRFGALRVSGYVNSFVSAEEKQFSAVTLTLEDGVPFVAFRGTDSTLVGWKEDFNMAFMTAIPSQREAVNYVQRVSEATTGNLHLGGHSKGGNLAIYAATYAPHAIQQRIAGVYNNDGPGFEASVLSSDPYQIVADRLHTYVPQSSVIGMLLEHEDSYLVVHSTQKGLMQHNPYTWEVLGPNFIHLKEVTQSSQFLNRTIKTWLSGMDTERRAQFIDALFALLSATDARTLHEISSKWYKNAFVLLKTFSGIDEPTRKMLGETITALLSTAGQTLFEQRPRAESEEAQDS